jgi:hypothetical protein
VIQPVGLAGVVAPQDVGEGEGSPRQGQVDLIVEGETVCQRGKGRVEGAVGVAEDLVVGKIRDGNHVRVDDPVCIPLLGRSR